MATELTRREALGRAAAGTAAAYAVVTGMPPRASAEEPLVPRFVWNHESMLIDRPQYNGAADQQLLFVTMMYVANKISGWYDRWYLWVWTHDAPICRLYTLSRPWGPVVNRGLCNMPAPPPGYEPSHFSSGDVVWDPSTRAFYSTPHCATLGATSQPTFLIKSTDGINWSYVRSDPIVRPTPGAWDSYQTAYGRFLRDYSGNLRRIAGQAIWYYRGEQSSPHRYAVGAASSGDLVNWTKRGRQFDPIDGGLLSLGSAISPSSGVSSGRIYLVFSTLATPTGGGGVMPMFLKESNAPGAPYSWAAGPGYHLYDDPTSVGYTDGGSYVIDPQDGVHHMAYANFATIGRPQVHTAVAYVA